MFIFERIELWCAEIVFVSLVLRECEYVYVYIHLRVLYTHIYTYSHTHTHMCMYLSYASTHTRVRCMYVHESASVFLEKLLERLNHVFGSNFHACSFVTYEDTF